MRNRGEQFGFVKKTEEKRIGEYEVNALFRIVPAWQPGMQCSLSSHPGFRDANSLRQCAASMRPPPV